MFSTLSALINRDSKRGCSTLKVLIQSFSVVTNISNTEIKMINLSSLRILSTQWSEKISQKPNLKSWTSLRRKSQIIEPQHSQLLCRSLKRKVAKNLNRSWKEFKMFSKIESVITLIPFWKDWKIQPLRLAPHQESKKVRLLRLVLKHNTLCLSNSNKYLKIGPLMGWKLPQNLSILRQIWRLDWVHLTLDSMGKLFKRVQLMEITEQGQLWLLLVKSISSERKTTC